MHPDEKDKMAFTKKQSNYCNKVMSFGLKNVGATYQQLINKILAKLIGKTIETYVDDTVVKSSKVDKHTTNLYELFDMLDLYQIKLNPEKCLFDVWAGKFLGLMLTSRRNKANLNWCSVVIDMMSLTNIKEVQ